MCMERTCTVHDNMTRTSIIQHTVPLQGTWSNPARKDLLPVSRPTGSQNQNGSLARVVWISAPYTSWKHIQVNHYACHTRLDIPRNAYRLFTPKIDRFPNKSNTGLQYYHKQISSYTFSCDCTSLQLRTVTKKERTCGHSFRMRRRRPQRNSGRRRCNRTWTTVPPFGWKDDEKLRKPQPG